MIEYIFSSDFLWDCFILYMFFCFFETTVYWIRRLSRWYLLSLYRNLRRARTLNRLRLSISKNGGI